MTRQAARIAAWIACLAGAPGLSMSVIAADNQDDRVTVLEHKLDRSLKLIEQLEARVRDLEAERAGTAKLAQPAQPVQPAPAQTAQQEKIGRAHV